MMESLYSFFGILRVSYGRWRTEYEWRAPFGLMDLTKPLAYMDGLRCKSLLWFEIIPLMSEKGIVEMRTKKAGVRGNARLQKSNYDCTTAELP